MHMRISASSFPMVQAVRQQPVAKKSAALRRKYVRSGIILLMIAIVAALLFVWMRVQVIQLGYEVSKIRRDTMQLREQKNILESEIAAQKSPQRLEEIAASIFGMRSPQGDEIVYVKPRQTGE